MSFLNSIEKLAGSVAVSLTSGNVLPTAVQIGKDVLELIDEAKSVVGSHDVAGLQAMRDELEPLVMAHADKTEAELRGS